MLILPLTVPMVAAVLADVPAFGRQEVGALCGADWTPQAVAEAMVPVSRFGAVFCTDDGRPVAAMGAAEELPELWPGMWSLWSAGASSWLEPGRKLQRLAIGAAVTRWAREVLLPALSAAGAVRAQAVVVAGPDGQAQQHRWLTRLLGAVAVASVPSIGPAELPAIIYAWDAASLARAGLRPAILRQAQDEGSVHRVEPVLVEGAEDRDAEGAGSGPQQERRRDRGGRGAAQARAAGGGLRLDRGDRRGGRARAGDDREESAAGAVGPRNLRDHGPGKAVQEAA